MNKFLNILAIISLIVSGYHLVINDSIAKAIYFAVMTVLFEVLSQRKEAD